MFSNPKLRIFVLLLLWLTFFYMGGLFTFANASYPHGSFIGLQAVLMSGLCFFTSIKMRGKSSFWRFLKYFSLLFLIANIFLNMRLEWFADYYGIDGYLVTPSGKMKEYESDTGSENDMYPNTSLKQDCGKSS